MKTQKNNRRNVLQRIGIALGVGALAIGGVIGVTSIGNDIKGMSENLLVSEGTSRGGMKLASVTQKTNNITTQTITATLGDSTVYNDKLDWTIAWNGTGSGNVNDYVGMTVASNTHSVTLTYKKQFATQIKVTATSNADSTITASCLVDCYKRVSNVSANLTTVMNGQTVNESNGSINLSGMVSYDSIFDEDDRIDELNLTFNKIGTKDTEVTYEAKLYLSSSLFYAFDDLSGAEGGSYDLTECWYDVLYEELGKSPTSDQEIMGILASNSHWFDIQINYTVKSGSTVVETGTSTIALKGFNIADGLSVGSITLNQSNITF